MGSIPPRGRIQCHKDWDYLRHEQLQRPLTRLGNHQTGICFPCRKGKVEKIYEDSLYPITFSENSNYGRESLLEV